MANRVYQINDCDWWVGDCGPATILKAYMEETGLSCEDATGGEDDMPRLLGRRELRRLMFEREDGSKHSFADELATYTAPATPQPFASTEY